MVQQCAESNVFGKRAAFSAGSAFFALRTSGSSISWLTRARPTLATLALDARALGLDA